MEQKAILAEVVGAAAAEQQGTRDKTMPIIIIGDMTVLSANNHGSEMGVEMLPLLDNILDG